jgi:hypothetical protein
MTRYNRVMDLASTYAMTSAAATQQQIAMSMLVARNQMDKSAVALLDKGAADLRASLPAHVGQNVDIQT